MVPRHLILTLSDLSFVIVHKKECGSEIWIEKFQFFNFTSLNIIIDAGPGLITRSDIALLEAAPKPAYR